MVINYTLYVHDKYVRMLSKPEVVILAKGVAN